MKRTTIFSFAAIFNGVNVTNNNLEDLCFLTGSFPSIYFGSGANFNIVGVSVYPQTSTGDALEFKSLTMEPIQVNGSPIYTAIGTNFVSTASTLTFINVTDSINILPQPIAVPAGLQIRMAQVLAYKTFLSDIKLNIQIFCEYED